MNGELVMQSDASHQDHCDHDIGPVHHSDTTVASEPELQVSADSSAAAGNMRASAP